MQDAAILFPTQISCARLAVALVDRVILANVVVHPVMLVIVSADAVRRFANTTKLFVDAVDVIVTVEPLEVMSAPADRFTRVIEADAGRAKNSRSPNRSHCLNPTPLRLTGAQ